MKTKFRTLAIVLLSVVCQMGNAVAEGFGPSCCYVQNATRPYQVDHSIYGLGVTFTFFTNWFWRPDSFDVYGLNLNLIDGTVFGESRYLRVVGVDVDILHTIIFAIPVLGAGATEVYGLQAGLFSEATERYGIGVAPLLGSDSSRGIDIGLLAASGDFAGIGIGAILTDYAAVVNGSHVTQLGLFNNRREKVSVSSGLMVGAFNWRSTHWRISEFDKSDKKPSEAPGSVLFQLGLYNSFEDATANSFTFQLGVWNSYEPESTSNESVLQLGVINYIKDGPVPFLPLCNMSF